MQDYVKHSPNTELNSIKQTVSKLRQRVSELETELAVAKTAKPETAKPGKQNAGK